MDTFEAELHAIALRCSPEFRVLRKLVRRTYCERPLGPRTKIGLIVDVETTGLDTGSDGDEIIELGMIKFAYTPGGVILGVVSQYEGFHQPNRPIPALVRRLTGITNDMVRGKRLDIAAIAAFVEDVDIVIAHNADFDRRFMERACPVFATLPWTCSQTQVKWFEEGLEGTKLFYLAYHFRFYFNGHRSIDDCYALLEILEQSLPESGQTPLAHLLAAVRQPSLRVYALGLPYDLKDRVRAHGYRWSNGEDGRPRAWHRDVTAEEVERELRFLDDLDRGDVLEPLVMELDAYVRFSDRQA
ncbi:3'-5' exonuclease [Methylobacterium sp. E-041]|uniref:3'-5' exonuclease n=1 Tax=Methylobacterium sp. E-041 TaxID=2836573 RepID=UPI001FBBBB0A|nr:3'-5' exonuclease [Methylobacterium sp. E-041]MCJ2106016.1 3'-5' exonuclease [Methylobacterium sp. E-041]